MSAVATRLAEFKQDVVTLEPHRVVQKHITFGDTEVLTRTQHFGLRSRIAEYFKIHPQGVVVVGSAKLGFSIKPQRRYGAFGDSSDIDVAIVSEGLFRRYWEGLQRYVDDGGYWERQSRFQGKFFDGWIRPDLMPPSKTYAPTSEWWEFFLQMTQSDLSRGCKVTGGIYFDWDCLDRYQIRAVEGCRGQERNL